MSKYTRVDGRYFTHFHSPGWPSRAFDRIVESELERPVSARGEARPCARLQILILAVTRLCPLRCVHCFEGEALDEPDNTSVEDLVSVVRRFQALGVTQIQLSGGEPLQRADVVLEILRRSGSGTDFWVLTSGVGLTRERGLQFKHAGLTGVAISLDHWEARAHDTFRGRKLSFDWAQRAARSAKEADLVLCLSLCATREFVDPENLRRYAKLATDLDADFIQIVEPHPVGRFAGHDVALRPEDQRTLEEFVHEMNFDRVNSSVPAICYPGRVQRRHGCTGAGLVYLYVDANLQIHRCPFCRAPMGSALHADLGRLIPMIQRAGCSEFGRPVITADTRGSVRHAPPPRGAPRRGGSRPPASSPP